MNVYKSFMQYYGIRKERGHKKNVPREIILVLSKRQVGGRGADGTRRISLGRFFLCRSEADGRERGRVSCFCANHLAYNKISSSM